MTTNNLNSAQPLFGEQEPNGVRTGLLPPELATLISAAANGWREKSTLPVDLLLALARLSSEQPDQAMEGFTAWDIAAAMGVIRGRAWAVGDDREKISDKVRVLWKRLSEDLWETKREGLCQRALDLGLTMTPGLHRIEGGGTGRPTRYRIVAVPLAVDELTPVSEPVMLAPGEIRYICEDMEDTGPLVRMFASGFEMSGWRKWMLFAALLVSLMLAFVLALLIFTGIIKQIPLKDLVYLLLGTVPLLLFLWITFGPVFRLPTSRILLAPWWMQSIEDDRLLEWRCPPKHSVKSIKAAHYSGVCPLCGGKVSVRSGGREFFGRLLGRCEESPREHVFSFDHVLRRGSVISRM